jgi:hypothetical protein
VTAGAQPDRGVVLTGATAASRPAGASWEADLRVGDVMITCRLPDKPPAAGSELVVTALDPPCFRPDGSALPLSAPGRGPTWPEQVRT